MSIPRHSFFESLPPEQQEALNKAAADAYALGNMDMLKNCFSAGADPTPIMFISLKNKNFKFLQACVDAGADVNASKEGIDEKDPASPYPAIHWCFANFSEQICDYLLEHGADVDTPSPYGNTPFKRAIGGKSEHMARYFLSKGADPLRLGAKGESPLQNIQSILVGMTYDERKPWQEIYVSMLSVIAEQAQSPQTVKASFNIAVDHDTVVETPKLSFPSRPAAKHDGGPKV